jgi:hypothetical protein
MTPMRPRSRSQLHRIGRPLLGIYFAIVRLSALSPKFSDCWPRHRLTGHPSVSKGFLQVSRRLVGRLTSQDRRIRINRILTICRENNWTYDTPDIAGKLYNIMKSVEFTRGTIRDYTVTIVDILAWEKKHHKPFELSPVKTTEKSQLLRWSPMRPANQEESCGKIWT